MGFDSSLPIKSSILKSFKILFNYVPLGQDLLDVSIFIDPFTTSLSCSSKVHYSETNSKTKYSYFAILNFVSYNLYVSNI